MKSQGSLYLTADRVSWRRKPGLCCFKPENFEEGSMYPVRVEGRKVFVVGVCKECSSRLTAHYDLTKITRL